MNILICNDDGIFSEGILTLANVLCKEHNVVVIAPDNNRSGYSHSMSFFKELTLKKHNLSENFQSFSLNGTPADCVKFGIFYYKGNFDLIIGGVNIGNNIGTDILYSGTVSIGIEASINGFKNIALSLTETDNINYKILAENCYKIINKMLPYLSSEVVWNINIPNKRVDTLKTTKLGIQKYSDTYKKVGDNTYMLIGEPINHKLNDDDCDVEWALKGYATATPIKIDKTEYSMLQKMAKEIDL